jgi:phenylpyruvate tautomerase PptA (4-oxalocrotonate tautomerase family)
MPYISIGTSKELKDRQKEQIKAKMGEAICLIPGKSEAVTMVDISDGRAIYLGGKALDNGAFVEVRLLGKAESKNKEALACAIFGALEETLGTQKDAVYINILEMDCWGLGGRWV